MSRYLPTARPLARCLRTAGAHGTDAAAAFRPATASAAAAAAAAAAAKRTIAAPLSLRSSFTTSSRQGQTEPTHQKTATAAPPPPPLSSSSDGAVSSDNPAGSRWELDPALATQPWAEKELMRRGTPPVGSRRRRAALQLMTAEAAERAIRGEDDGGDADIIEDEGPIPFELMPYHCFQEARKVLLADRQEKLRQIAAETAKIRRLQEVLAGAATGATPITSRGGAAYVQRRLASLRQHVEHLKVLADSNDPQVKRRFEDGQGDMNKPIYRHLAEQRWRGRPLRIVRQRIDQFHLAPDLLPPAYLRSERLRADVELFFRSYRVPSGAVVDSLISEVCPRLRVQVFDRGTRLVTVAIVDADVPDPATDSFSHRCHFLATNIPIAPTDPSVPLSRADPAAQLVLPWLPAFAQKGSPPHRLAVFVLEQPPVADDNAGASASAASPTSVSLDAETLRTSVARDGFNIRSFVDRHGLSPVGCTLFRTKWDAGTATVMERIGVPGADVELRPVHLPSLKPPRKRRGWEAKREGPKFRHLWKYTHRIATPKRKFVR